MARRPVSQEDVQSALETIRERDADLATRKAPDTLPAGLRWEKVPIPRESLHGRRVLAGEIDGDPMYQWQLWDGDRGIVVVYWEERHGWDAYSQVCGGFLEGKWSGPDLAYEDEEWAKRAAEEHALELRSEHPEAT
jgi:hypothetical protein